MRTRVEGYGGMMFYSGLALCGSVNFRETSRVPVMPANIAEFAKAWDAGEDEDDLIQRFPDIGYRRNTL